MSVGIGTALAIGGTLAAGGVASSVIGANAAGKAANQQVSAEQQAINQTTAAQAPYLSAGTTSLAQLMKGLQNGTFGAGSIPAFSAPTAAQAEATPGYQFTQQEGDKGILAGAAAAGGAINGGTLKSLAGYNSNLATTTYGNTFNQSLQTYAAALQGQQQAYNQIYQPSALGEAATQNQNASLSQLLQAQGNSQAAGTIGAANAINSGIGNVTNGIAGTLTLGQLLGSGGSGAGPVTIPTGAPVYNPATGGSYAYQPGIGPG